MCSCCLLFSVPNICTVMRKSGLSPASQPGPVTSFLFQKGVWWWFIVTFPPPLPRSRCCWCSVTCSLQPPQSCTVHPAPLWGAPSHPCAWGSPGWVTRGGHCSQEDVVLLAKDAAITPTLGTPPCRVLTGPLLACTVLWFGSQTPPSWDICSGELRCRGSAPCVMERLVP